VPGGFVVLTAYFRRAVEAVRSTVGELDQAALAAARVRASGATESRLAAACLRLGTSIREVGKPAEVPDGIRAAHARQGPEASVAVRSSAVGEDSAARLRP
jgi:pyruvate,water dikinase